MKKFIVILSILFVATFVNAQITLEHTFNGSIDAPIIREGILGDYYIQADKTNNTIIVYDANNYSVVWSLNMPNTRAYLYSSNIFTTDGKFACLVEIRDDSKTDNTRCHLYVYDEDKNIIADLGTSWDHEYLNFVKVSSGYKLLVEKVAPDYSFTTEIYSLPGNGETSEDVSTPSAPRKSSSRKYLGNDQVLVENGDKTYTVTGQRIQ